MFKHNVLLHNRYVREILPVFSVHEYISISVHLKLFCVG